jgi:hypothetical protein
VKRLPGLRRSIMDFAGCWKNIPEDDLTRIRASYSEGRKRDRQRMEKLIERRR